MISSVVPVRARARNASVASAARGKLARSRLAPIAALDVHERGRPAPRGRLDGISERRRQAVERVLGVLQRCLEPLQASVPGDVRAVLAARVGGGRLHQRRLGVLAGRDARLRLGDDVLDEREPVRIVGVAGRRPAPVGPALRTAPRAVLARLVDAQLERQPLGLVVVAGDVDAQLPVQPFDPVADHLDRGPPVDVVDDREVVPAPVEDLRAVVGRPGDQVASGHPAIDALTEHWATAVVEPDPRHRLGRRVEPAPCRAPVALLPVRLRPVLERPVLPVLDPRRLGRRIRVCLPLGPAGSHRIEIDHRMRI